MALEQMLFNEVISEANMQIYLEDFKRFAEAESTLSDQILFRKVGAKVKVVKRKVRIPDS